jgi:hypothetical protein
VKPLTMSGPVGDKYQVTFTFCAEPGAKGAPLETYWTPPPEHLTDDEFRKFAQLRRWMMQRVANHLGASVPLIARDINGEFQAETFHPVKAGKR